MKETRTPVLLPHPREIMMHLDGFTFQNQLMIFCHGQSDILSEIVNELNEVIQVTQKVRGVIRVGELTSLTTEQVVLSLDSSKSIPAQGYHLSITQDKIWLTASDAAGLFYGSKTLIQLLRQYEGFLPACEIEDYPDFPVRGVMLDISRDKVPTLETLFRLIDELAEWKINHLELYTEHTFSYSKHPAVWAQASPMTGEDILRLDAYCRKRFIELVPNQNSFGHMDRWLKHPQYIGLAECPDGFDHPCRHFDDPFGLDPTNPESLTLLSELYGEVLPYFTSKKFNVGCDETIDLGLGKSKAMCEQKGQGRVYLEFLLKIYELVRSHGRTMLFWGDIILKHPELVSELPRDITVLEWGYEADHPFDEHCAKLAATGIPFYVCPGTSSWLSISGRTDNCLNNLRSAACNGLKHGATGFLNTDWGDMGHWQYLPISYLGFAAGAALSWCYDANKERDFIEELNTHVFKDASKIMGELACDLGNAYLHIGHLVSNGCAIARMLYYPNESIPQSITQETLTATVEYIQKVISPLDNARMNRADGLLIAMEFENAAAMLLAACHRGLAIRQGKIEREEVRNQLAVEMRRIMDKHSELWMARNRVGGLFDSMKRLEKLLESLHSFT
jgi:hypothetical protein